MAATSLNFLFRTLSGLVIFAGAWVLGNWMLVSPSSISNVEPAASVIESATGLIMAGFSLLLLGGGADARRKFWRGLAKGGALAVFLMAVLMLINYAASRVTGPAQVILQGSNPVCVIPARDPSGLYMALGFIFTAIALWRMGEPKPNRASLVLLGGVGVLIAFIGMLPLLGCVTGIGPAQGWQCPSLFFVAAFGTVLAGGSVLLFAWRKLDLHLTLERGVFLSFGVAMFFLGVIGLTSWQTTRQAVELSGRIHHTREVMDELDAIEADLLNMESGLRGFIITGNEKFLAPFAKDRKGLQEHLSAVQQLTADNPNQQRDLLILSPMAAKRAALLDQSIDLRRNDSSNVQAQIKLTLENEMVMDHLHAEIAKMMHEERRLLTERVQAEHATADRAILTILLGIGVAFGISLIAALSINRSMERRRKAEAASTHLAAIVACSATAILSETLEGVLTSWNGEAERLFGYTAWEIIGQSVYRLIPPERREEEKQLLANIKAGGPIHHVETVRVTKDGRMVDVSLTLSPIRAEAGLIIGASSIMQDISDRKRAESALLEAQAKLQEHADTLETTVADRTARLRETIGELESFSYSLSHDMRAPLRSITSFAEIAQAECGENDAIHLYMDKVVCSAKRLDRMIQDVLSYTKISRQAIKAEQVDVDQLLHEIINERSELQASRAVVTVESPLLPIWGNTASLTQCLTNLLGNAVKFVAPGVLPRVRVYTEDAGDAVRLWIEDNGIGIRREAQSRLFEMFYRANCNPTYEGTGLGLAITRKAVERMGGQIGLESEVGRGTRFWILLPKAVNKNRSQDRNTYEFAHNSSGGG